MPPRDKGEDNHIAVLDPNNLEDTMDHTLEHKREDIPHGAEDMIAKCDKKGLTKVEKFCFGVGHVYNDLCASMWFSYLLIFFEKVLVFDGTLAGVILLVGQLADGFATPVVGILADRENKIAACARYGRRKIWHLIGTICVTVSFPFIFSPAYGLQDAGYTAQTIYYCFFVVIFQFGWASVQISHLSLIPALTPRKDLRTELNSIRYAFTVLSNLSVFAIALVLLEMNNSDPMTTVSPLSSTTPATTPAITTTELFTGTTPDENTCSNEGTALDPNDLGAFRTIAGICVGVGLLFSIIFHVGVKEPAFKCPKKNGNGEIRMRKLDWFKQLPFYVVALLYMATRLYNNLYMVYVPLLVQDTLCLAKSAIATVPFAMYFAGFLFSLIMKPLNGYIGRKGTFAIGCVLGLIGCTWTFTSAYMTSEAFTTWGIYVVAVFLGSGGSTLLITSLSITADLIGKNTEGGAFVYGLMSLVDKFSNGIAIMVIQNEDTGLASYYRLVMFYACGGACVMGLVAVLFMIPIKVGDKKGSKTAQAVKDFQDMNGGANMKSSEENHVKTKKDLIENNNTGVCTKNNPSADILACVADKVAEGHPSMTGNGKVNPAADIQDSISGEESRRDKSDSVYTIDGGMAKTNPGIDRILDEEGMPPRDKRSSMSSLKDISNETRRRTMSRTSYEMVSPDHNPTADIIDFMSSNVVAAAERRESIRNTLE